MDQAAGHDQPPQLAEGGQAGVRVTAFDTGQDKLGSGALVTGPGSEGPVAANEAPDAQAVLEATGNSEHAQCLFCGKQNPIGFKLAFHARGDGSVHAVFPCERPLQSYPETLHGGVIAALLDSAMTNCLFSKGVIAVTAELTSQARS
jgi:hypothetical protein